MSAFESSLPEAVHSNDGEAVPCRYLQHKNYDHSTNLCRSFHFLFLYFVPKRGKGQGYRLMNGIEEMLTLVGQENERRPELLKISQYTDINSELWIKFLRFLQENGRPLNIAEIMKSAMGSVAVETGKLPLINLPIVKYDRRNPSEPLDSRGFNQLETALKAHVLGLYKKLVFREAVDASEPFEYEALREEIAPRTTRKSLLEWYNFIQYNCISPTRAVSLAERAQEIGELDIVEICQRKEWRSGVEELYEKEIGPIGRPQFKNPIAIIGMRNWNPPVERVIKTLLANNYPLGITLKELEASYSAKGLRTVDVYQDLITIIFNRGSKHSGRNTGKPDSFPHNETLLTQYFPTQEDMSVITSYLMLQSGWNKETVLAIDGEDFEHPLSSAFEDSMKVVFSEKNKSQGRGLPYEDPVRINAPTRSDDPFSMYSLINLANALSRPLQGFTEDEDEGGSKQKWLNPTFLALRVQKEWKKGGRVTSAAHLLSFAGGMKMFLENNEIISHGKRLKSAGDLTLRLRPTWLLYKKEEHPMSVLSQNMGHASRDTTDIYYDSNGAATMERDARLRSELEHVMELLRAFRFKGLLPKQTQEEATASLKVFHIPGHGQRPLWACSDQSRPDWPGAQIIARTGRKCASIPNCIFCSRMRVFEESLVYLMERLSHIDEQLDGADEDLEGEFSSRLANEKASIQWIIDNWGDEKAEKRAERARDAMGPLLPRDLGLLEIIFNSESENV